MTNFFSFLFLFLFVLSFFISLFFLYLIFSRSSSGFTERKHLRADEFINNKFHCYIWWQSQYQSGHPFRGRSRLGFSIGMRKRIRRTQEEAEGEEGKELSCLFFFIVGRYSFCLGQFHHLTRFANSHPIAIYYTFTRKFARKLSCIGSVY